MEQKTAIFNNLTDTFHLPIFEDEIAEDEEKDLDANGYNCFILETGDLRATRDIKTLNQDIFIIYYSENKDDVDEKVIDIISLVSSVKAVTFASSRKDRLQKKNTDRFIDRIELRFVRRVPLERKV